MSNVIVSIKVPEKYKSHFVVHDPKPMLVITYTDTLLQSHIELGQSYQDFEVTREEDFLFIKEI